MSVIAGKDSSRRDETAQRESLQQQLLKQVGEFVSTHVETVTQEAVRMTRNPRFLSDEEEKQLHLCRASLALHVREFADSIQATLVQVHDLPIHRLIELSENQMHRLMALSENLLIRLIRLSRDLQVQALERISGFTADLTS